MFDAGTRSVASMGPWARREWSSRGAAVRDAARTVRHAGGFSVSTDA